MPDPTVQRPNGPTDLDFAETLWKAADALRGQVDAAEYKHVVLGLLFLKYISDAFEASREELKVELEKGGIAGMQLEALLESRDEYTAERVFWVPPESRWPNLQNQATRPDIATLIHHMTIPNGWGGGEAGLVWSTAVCPATLAARGTTHENSSRLTS